MASLPGGPLAFLAAAFASAVALRLFLSRKSLMFLVFRVWRWAEEKTQAYQYYEVPSRHGDFDNPLYPKAVAYVASLPSLEDADAACLLSSASKPNDFSLQLGKAHTVQDGFLGSRVSWTNADEGRKLVLRVRRQDKTRVLRPYLQHVESVADEMEQRRRELRLYTNSSNSVDGVSWSSAPFTHPATLETVAMDPDLKARIRADLELFLKGRSYYHRLGRAWRRSYLLYGAPGTGKSTFAAAMARFLGFDVYDIDISRCSDLKEVLQRTTARSLILVEDIDRYLQAHKGAGILDFMDGVAACCGEERVTVFTMSGAKEGVDPAVLRPGRLDVHIHFPMCDFSAFKVLAGSYLGLKEHKLFPQVEESFAVAGPKLSPAEVGELMLANRSSPSRALRTVIGVLQHVAAESTSAPHVPRSSTVVRVRAGSDSWSTKRLEDLANGMASGDLGILNGGASGLSTAGNSGVVGPPPPYATDGNTGSGGQGKDPPLREFKKLYGLIKIKSRRDGGVVPVEVDTPTANGRMNAAGVGKD